jgi:hypothetical protein
VGGRESLEEAEKKRLNSSPARPISQQEVSLDPGISREEVKGVDDDESFNY